MKNVDKATETLKNFGYVTFDYRSLLQEAHTKAIPLRNLIEDYSYCETDPGEMYFDRSGTVIRFTTNEHGEQENKLGMLRAPSILARVSPTTESNKYRIQQGKNRKSSSILHIPSGDTPIDDQILCTQKQRYGSEHSTIAVYGTFSHFEVVSTPDPRRDHYTEELDRHHKHTFKIGGTINSVRKERNSLTGATFCIITVTSLFPLTLLAEDPEAELPRIGDIALFHADIYFSRLLPLLEKYEDIIPPPRITGTEQKQQETRFVPLHEQNVTDEQPTDNPENSSKESRLRYPEARSLNNPHEGSELPGSIHNGNQEYNSTLEPHPLLNTLGFGPVTFNEVERLATDHVNQSPGSTGVFDDPSGIRVVIPSSSRVGTRTILIRSTSSTPGLLTWKSPNEASVRLTSAVGKSLEFDATVGDWSLFGHVAGQTSLAIGAIATTVQVRRLRASDLRKRRTEAKSGRKPAPGLIKPLDASIADGVAKYQLTGTVLAWTLKSNKLTGGTWYQVKIASVVEISVAVPVTVGKIGVGDTIDCTAIMCVAPSNGNALSKEGQDKRRVAHNTSKRTTITTEDKKLLAVGFAANSRESLVREVLKASQQTHKTHAGIENQPRKIHRYADPSGAVLLVLEDQSSKLQLVPMLGGDDCERVVTTAGSSAVDTEICLYNGSDSVQNIPADSDNYTLPLGTVSDLTRGMGVRTGALAVDINMAEPPRTVPREVSADVVDDGLTWISGNVISSSSRLNELTGLSWYEVKADVGVPITVAVPETDGPIPVSGSSIWGTVRFCIGTNLWKINNSENQSESTNTTADKSIEESMKYPDPKHSYDDANDIDDIDDGGGRDRPQHVTDLPNSEVSGNRTTQDNDASYKSDDPAIAFAESVEENIKPTIIGEGVSETLPLPQGWLSYIQKGLEVPDIPSVDFETTTAGELGPFWIVEVRDTSVNEVRVVYVERNFPVAASYCGCKEFIESSTCPHLHPAFSHVHSTLCDIDTLAEELFERLGSNPVEGFFAKYSSDSNAMEQFMEAIGRNGGDSRKAVLTAVNSISKRGSSVEKPGVKFVDYAIDNNLSMLPVLTRLLSHASDSPADETRRELFRVIDLSLGRRPSQKLRTVALQSLSTLYSMAGITEGDRESLAALVVTTFRFGGVEDSLPFLSAEDHLGVAGLEILRTLTDKWREELIVDPASTHSLNRSQFQLLSRLMADSFGDLDERITSLLEAEPPELATAVLLLEGHGRTDKALEVLNDLLKAQPKNVTSTTPYQMPLHDAFQILKKHRRKKSAARLARRQFRESPCWDSYLDLEEALRMSGVSDSLKERDVIMRRLENADELTLEEVEVLVRLKLRGRDLDAALSVMEGRGLYDQEWAADTSSLRSIIRTTIADSFPDRLVDVAFRDAYLSVGDHSSENADGLQKAAEILQSAASRSSQVGQREAFSSALSSFRRNNLHNALLMAILDGKRLT